MDFTINQSKFEYVYDVLHFKSCPCRPHEVPLFMDNLWELGDSSRFLSFFRKKKMQIGQVIELFHTVSCAFWYIQFIRERKKVQSFEKFIKYRIWSTNYEITFCFLHYYCYCGIFLISFLLRSCFCCLLYVCKCFRFLYRNCLSALLFD